MADIYFIAGLSRRGERVQLFGSRSRGESTNALIRRHCPSLETKMSGKVKILTIDNFLLRTMLHTMARIARL